ncbi:MAG: hypothetical protein NXI30_08905 [bacterium]|nr:hypothetical protein [bacterium]
MSVGPTKARRRDRLTLFAVGLVGAAWSLTALAQPPTAYDTTLLLGASPPILVEDEDVVAFSPSGPVVLADLPPLPANAGLNAFERDGPDVLFSLDVTAIVEGTTIEPRDVARWNGSALSLEIDGSAVGIPDGIEIDAVALSLSTGNLLISIDGTALVGPVTVEDEDLLRPAPAPLIVFDGSAEGIDPALDLNGFGLLTPTLGLLTFDGSGQVDGIDFDDEDLLAWDFTTGAFTLYLDGSALRPATPAADVQAVPEPLVGRMTLWGVLALASRGLRKRVAERRRAHLAGVRSG